MSDVPIDTSDTLIATLERIAVALERVGDGVEQLTEVLVVELSEVSVIAVKAGHGGVELKARTES